MASIEDYSTIASNNYDYIYIFKFLNNFLHPPSLIQIILSDRVCGKVSTIKSYSCNVSPADDDVSKIVKIK